MDFPAQAFVGGMLWDFFSSNARPISVSTIVDSQMEFSPRVTVLAMVLDTLSGRTPLYRLEVFFQEKIPN